MHSADMQVLIAITSALALIVLLAQFFGSLASRVGQPAVVGEMIAGVVLGPSVLGALFPDLFRIVFDANTRSMLYSLGMIGLCLYMFLVGLEHEDAPRNRSYRSLPLVLGCVNFAVSVLLGALTAYWLASPYRPADVQPYLFYAFVGVAISITALPVLARILQERKMVQTHFGSTAIITAAIDDALAWCGLAVIVALHLNGNATGAILTTIVPTIIFACASFFILPRLFAKRIERAVDAGVISDGLFTGVLGTVLISGLITDYIGVYSVFGGFIAGISFPRVRGFYNLMKPRLHQIVKCFFLPIFFIFAGLNTYIWDSLFGSTLLLAFGLIVAAAASKALPCVIVLTAFRWRPGETLAMAALMNARGLMVLISATIGLSVGLIHTEIFSVLVLIAVVSTALALPVYRIHFTKTVEEDARQRWSSEESPYTVPHEVVDPEQ
ncbi:MULTISPECIES: cation:proton antiporter [Rhizobium/Agrobacterium group]|uniref:cation:proton antiporter n=1 Tax=Rhizobium/Agrobacterium group TaxID=227290 RepID=UPI0018D25A7D|nr:MULTISPECIES: cation:proton antiporter [Rhizobium/Agrobacterium group]